MLPGQRRGTSKGSAAEMTVGGTHGHRAGGSLRASRLPAGARQEGRIGGGWVGESPGRPGRGWSRGGDGFPKVGSAFQKEEGTVRHRRTGTDAGTEPGMRMALGMGEKRSEREDVFSLFITMFIYFILFVRVFGLHVCLCTTRMQCL